MPSPLYRAYRRLRYGPPVVVVSGLPRSGTSMAMKMLEAGGIEVVTDGRREADDDNPRGYYEFERVKDLAEDPDKSWMRLARGKAIKVISSLLRHLPTDNTYKVLLIRRHFDEILASQEKMLANRSENSETEDARMKELFERDLFRARYLLRTEHHFESIELDYSDFVDDPPAQAERIRRFVGRPLDLRRMAAVVDPRLYRNRAG